MKHNLYQLSQETLAEGEDRIPTILVIDEIDDVVSEQAAIDGPATDMARAVTAAQRLEDVAQTIDEVTNPQDFVTVVDGKTLEVVIESIYEELGIAKPRELSMEADTPITWGERASRIKESATKLIAAIIEALRRAFESVKEYLFKVFQASARLEKYAYQTLQDIRKLKGEPSKKTYNNARLAKALYNKPDGLEVTYEHLFTLVEDAERSASSGLVPAVVRMIQTFVDNRDSSDVVNGLPDLFKRTFSNIFPHDPDNSIIDIVNPPEGVNIHTTAMLPGGYYGVISVPDTVDHLRKFYFAIRRSNDKNDYGSELDVMSIDQMKWALDSIIKVTSTIRRFEAVERRNGSAMTSLKSAVDRLKKVDSELMVSPNRDVLRALAAMAPTLARGIHTQTFVFALQSFRSLIEHCKRSADLYSDGKSEVVSA